MLCICTFLDCQLEAFPKQYSSYPRQMKPRRSLKMDSEVYSKYYYQERGSQKISETRYYLKLDPSIYGYELQLNLKRVNSYTLFAKNI